METVLFFAIFVVKFWSVNCINCPNHCFCYEWNSMIRTDCVNRNMYNTFASFSPKTQVLDLSYNVISILHGNEFLDANLKELKDLRISNNRLHKIDKLSFNGLVHLEYLDMSHNSIEFITPTTFKYNPMLKVLNVSNNPLSFKANEPFLSDAPALQVLNMAYCNLRIIYQGLFLHLNKLRSLNISNNGITIIQPEVLKPLLELKLLDLTKNDLTCDDVTKSLQGWLIKQHVNFQPFCPTANEMMASVILSQDETELTDSNEGDLNIEVVSKTPPEKIPFFEEVKRLLQSIPSFYAMLCGIQIGILIGSICTYFCVRKAPKLNSNDEDPKINRSSRLVRNDSDNMNLALISLHTPPGTPPSPYHSRLTFSSNFSLTRM